MIGWLLDTNVMSEVFKRRSAPEVTGWLDAQPEQSLFLSVLTFGEADQGIHKFDPADRERRRLSGKWEAIEERFAGRILGLSTPIVRRWGRISGEMKRSGAPSPVIDTLLAATAIEHDLYLVTRNTKDVKLSGAALFNPWKDDPNAFPLAS